MENFEGESTREGAKEEKEKGNEQKVSEMVKDAYSNMLKGNLNNDQISDENRVDMSARLLKSFVYAKQAFGDNLEQKDLELMLKDCGYENVEKIIEKYNSFDNEKGESVNGKEGDSKNYY